MSSFQMALTIGGFIIFSLVSVALHSTILQNSDTLQTTGKSQGAISIGRAILDEIQQKKFDQAVVGSKVIRTWNLSETLGCETGEVYPDVNDIDDYHGLTFVSPAMQKSGVYSSPTLADTEGYAVTCTVQYVDPSNPGNPSMVRTFAKRVSLTITNAFSQDSVSMSYIASY